jgi:hypothetical protein
MKAGNVTIPLVLSCIQKSLVVTEKFFPGSSSEAFMLHTVNEHGFIRGKTRKVTLNGEDVSDDAFACDDEAGWVDLWLPRVGGRRPRHPNGELLSERKYGQIKVEYIDLPERYKS